MHMILRYPSGRLVDGILLAVGPELLRFVVKRRNETMELQLKEGHWTAENGDRVELECMLTHATGSAGFSYASGFRTSAATHSYPC